MEDYKYIGFLKDLVKLEPQEILGLAHMMGVQIYEDKNENQNNSNSTQTQTPDVEVRERTNLKELDKTPRDGQAILSDILVAFESLNRTARRRLEKIVHKAVKR